MIETQQARLSQSLYEEYADNYYNVQTEDDNDSTGETSDQIEHKIDNLGPFQWLQMMTHQLEKENEEKEKVVEPSLQKKIGDVIYKKWSRFSEILCYIGSFFTPIFVQISDVFTKIGVICNCIRYRSENAKKRNGKKNQPIISDLRQDLLIKLFQENKMKLTHKQKADLKQKQIKEKIEQIDQYRYELSNNQSMRRESTLTQQELDEVEESFKTRLQPNNNENKENGQAEIEQNPNYEMEIQPALGASPSKTLIVTPKKAKVQKKKTSAKKKEVRFSNQGGESNSDIIKQFMKPRIIFEYVDLFYCSIIQIIKLFGTITVITAALLDFITKYNSKVTKHRLTVAECRHQYENNKCSDPVPKVREFCQTQEQCYMDENVIKYINIFTDILTEVINDCAEVLTHKALILIGLIILLLAGVHKVFGPMNSDKSVKQASYDMLQNQ